MSRSARSRFVVASLALSAALGGATAVRAQHPNFTPDDSSGIYGVGHRVGWTVALPQGARRGARSYTYTIRRNGGELIDSGSIDLGRGPARIETSLDAPAMVLVEVKPSTPDSTFGHRSTGGPGRVLLGAAVQPTGIVPAEPEPADFDAFWQAKLKELAAVPMDAVVTPGESGRAGVEYATVRMNNIRGAHVYGQLARPARAGRFPALVIYQWASPPYPLHKSWVTDRAAEGWLVLNVQPHDVPTDMPQAFYDALPAMIKNYHLIGQHSREESYFLQMYLGAYRAVEYLASRPDWDGTTLVVTGTSMGGQQSFAAAGLNPRVNGLVVHVPAGADVGAALHGRAPSYPMWNVSRPEVLETARYFDVANFAPRITARSLVSMGFLDELTTPASIWATFNRLRGPKEAVPLPRAAHNHLATAEQQLPYTRRAAEWLAALARGDDPTASGAPSLAAGETWVGTWATSPQLTEPANLPPEPGLAGNTLRQEVRVSLGGDRLRARFSNEFGSSAVTLNAVHVAASRGGGAIDPATDRALTFRGSRSVTIPPGAAVLSDPFSFALRPLSTVAITIHFGATSPDVTGHPGSRTTSYLVPGAVVSAAELPGAARADRWYIISGLEVAAPASSGAVVTLGNSITDGRGSGTNRHNRWPDELARRLQAEPRTADVAVLNHGIGGNCVLRACLGPAAVERFERDVLGQSGARWLIVLEGVNDLGQAQGPEGAGAVARELIAAYERMIERAHRRGIRVYGATILPFGGSFYDAPERERARQTVNRWIRTSGRFDAVIDLDAALRDPANPSRLRPEADTGDHLHPNEAGHRMIAEAIDLALFRDGEKDS